MEKEILTFIETKFETGTDAKQIKNCRNFGEADITSYFEVIAESVGQFTGLTDKKGVIIDVSKSYCTLTGYTRAE